MGKKARDDIADLGVALSFGAAAQPLTQSDLAAVIGVR